MLMSTLADALSKIVLKFNGVIFNIYHVRCSILLFTFLDEHLEEECVKCFIFFFLWYTSCPQKCIYYRPPYQNGNTRKIRMGRRIGNTMGHLS